MKAQLTIHHLGAFKQIEHGSGVLTETGQSFCAYGLKLAALSLVATLGLFGCIAPEDSGQASGRAEAILYKNAVPVAIVGESRIYDIDIDRAALAAGMVEAGEALDTSTPEYSQLLDQLIDQRLLRLEAQKQNLPQEAEVQFRLKEERERVLSRYLVQKRLETAVTDEVLRNLYESQSSLRQNGREANISRLRVATEDDIKTVLKRLEAGEEFAQLAEKLSIDEGSRRDGGNLGYLSRAMMSDELSERAFVLKVGDISDPFKTAQGWEIIKLNGYRLPPQASFEAMQPQLKAFQTYKEVQDLMSELRSGTEVIRLNIEANPGGDEDNKPKKDVTNE